MTNTVDRDQILQTIRSSQKKMQRFEVIVGVVSVILGVAMIAMSPMIVAEQAEKEASSPAPVPRATPLNAYLAELRAKNGNTKVASPTVASPRIVSTAMKKAKGTAKAVWWVGFGMALLGIVLIGQKIIFAKPNIAKILAETPKDVVWLYKKVQTGSVSGVRVARFEFLVFGLANKKLVAVKLKPEIVKESLGDAATLAPHATVGYSRKMATVYKNNPLDLQKGLQTQDA